MSFVDGRASRCPGAMPGFHSKSPNCRQIQVQNQNEQNLMLHMLLGNLCLGNGQGPAGCVHTSSASGGGMTACSQAVPYHHSNPRQMSERRVKASLPAA